MTVPFLLQVITNGLVLGLIYVLVALGLTLIFGIARMFNFAHGEFYMIGAFLVYYLVERFGVPYYLSLILAPAVVGVIGIAMERFLFRPVRGQFHAPVVMSLGIGMILQSLGLLVFGEDDRSVSTVLSGTASALGVSVSIERLFVVAVGAVLVLALHLFLQSTKEGQALQAVAQDGDAAAVQGIDVDRTAALVFGLAAILAALAGGLMVPVLSVNAFSGHLVIFKALVVIILGGMGSIPGAVLGGLLLGFIESFGGTFIGTQAQMIGFIVMILVLLIKPSGLLGRDL